MLPLIAIVGPTASGKTRHAVNLARQIDAEIISADSRQVYRGMDIGTGKDIAEYGDVPYHLIDICDAGEKYNLHRFITDFRKAYDSIRSRGRNAILCGGTGMYVETALAGISLPEVPRDEELRRSLEDKSLSELTEILASMKHLHNTTDVDTRQRALRAIEIETWYQTHPADAMAASRATATPLDARIFCIDIPRDLRRQRIAERLDARLKEGMVEEVERLLAGGLTAEQLIYYGLEYKYVTEYVIGRISRSEMHQQLLTAIHQFAKRQMTWFRGMERRGFTLIPHSWDRPLEAADVSRILGD